MAKKDLKISEGEHKFMSVVWDVCPAKSQVVVDECEKRYGWHKSTTYTLVRRMISQGIIENKETIVKPLVSREEIQVFDSKYVVENRFDGSLPTFIAAFVGDKKISKEEAEEIKKLIDKMA